ncbi:MAG TPA: protein-disulfide reductase DsbD domain-containing protein [Pyrinomonadaceae bacterium]|nr:protein-disulfide reductase DsbD domain-containing protein [Pyrinomonadaceae bacterium]
MVGCSKTETPSNPEPKPGVTSTGVVKATPVAASLARGESGEAVVQLRIDNGYHVNANPPSFNYLIATELELTPAAGISVASITYPDGLKKNFSFSDQPLSVYEGTTDLKVRLTAAKTAQPGEHNLSGKLRVQACDDQVCYAPGTMDLTLPVTVR